MEKAIEAARKGDLVFFQIPSEAEQRLDDDGRSLFHTACTSGSLKLVKLLSERGAVERKYVVQADDEGWTPLMSAVSCGQEQITEFLLGIGAEVDKQNSGGQAALHYAASKGNAALVRMLLKSGGKVNIKDKTGSTPLHRAASAGKQAAVQVLIEEGNARLEDVDRLGQTPLFVCVESGHAQVALYLMSRGADLEAVTKEGQTVRSVADVALLKVLTNAPNKMDEEADE